MSIIDAEDLEVFMGLTFTSSQSLQAQIIADYASSYIEEETSTEFGFHENYTERQAADADGIYTITSLPVVAVHTIHDYRTDTDLSEGTSWRFDGIDTVYGLYPGQVVDVTYDYGAEDPPESIAGVAYSLASRLMNALIEGNDQGIILRQVGDVIVQFGDLSSFNMMEQKIIDRYDPFSSYTMDLASRRNLRHGGFRSSFPDVSFMPGECWD